jgi:hypothetical protein
MAPPTIASCCLTAEQKDSLIEAVYERPVIWDCSTADYQDVQNRRSAFAEVADLLSDDKNRYTGWLGEEGHKSTGKREYLQGRKCKSSGKNFGTFSIER